MRNSAVTVLVARRGFCAPLTDGNNAILNPEALMAITISCQVTVKEPAIADRSNRSLAVWLQTLLRWVNADEALGVADSGFAAGGFGAFGHSFAEHCLGLISD